MDAVEVRLDDGSTGLVLPGDVDDDRGNDQRVGPWVALLPGLDPTTMGWKRRDWYLDPAIASRVTDRNGNIGPTVDHGRTNGTRRRSRVASVARQLTDHLRTATPKSNFGRNIRHNRAQRAEHRPERQAGWWGAARVGQMSRMRGR